MSPVWKSKWYRAQPLHFHSNVILLSSIKCIKCMHRNIRVFSSADEIVSRGVKRKQKTWIFRITFWALPLLMNALVQSMITWVEVWKRAYTDTCIQMLYGNEPPSEPSTFELKVINYVNDCSPKETNGWSFSLYLAVQHHLMQSLAYSLARLNILDTRLVK